MAGESSPRMTPEAERDLRYIAEQVIERSVDHVRGGFYCDWCSPDRVTQDHHDSCLILICLRYRVRRDDPGRNQQLPSYDRNPAFPVYDMRHAKRIEALLADEAPEPYDIRRTNEVVHIAGGATCLLLNIVDTYGDVKTRKVWVRHGEPVVGRDLVVTQGPENIRGLRIPIKAIDGVGRIVVPVLPEEPTEYAIAERKPEEAIHHGEGRQRA